MNEKLSKNNDELKRLNKELESKIKLLETEAHENTTDKDNKGTRNQTITEISGPMAHRRKTLAIILLDVRNAFNSVNWRSIRRSLRERNISPYLRRIIDSYLHDRSIQDSNGRTHPMTA